MKKVIIVGAGISGLTSGIYALQSGFDVEIYEKHNMTGGVCTSWKRECYTFEGAVHWLTGSSKKASFYRAYEEVGILNDSLKTYRHDPYTVFEYNGEQISLCRDVEKLEEHLLNISKPDKKIIKKLCKDINAFGGMSVPLMDERNVKVNKKAGISFRDILRMMPAIIRMKRLTSISIAEYVKSFKHKGIQEVLKATVPEKFNLMSLIATMATFQNDGHFPEGGALALVKRMTDKYTSLGGKLILSSKVDKIDVIDGHAKGIVVNGSKISSDVVIVTQDIITATENLFDNPPSDEWIVNIKNNVEPVMCTMVGIGVHADMSKVPHKFIFKPQIPVEYAGEKQEYIGITNYALHENYAPENNTSLTMAFIGDKYDWWKKAKSENRYKEEKDKLSEQIKIALEQKFPELVGNIEIIDIATPLTYEKYTGSYKGSWMSILAPNSMTKYNPLTSKDIKNLFFAGFRTFNPGGLPPSIFTGRKVVQLICKQFDSVFQGRENI